VVRLGRLTAAVALLVAALAVPSHARAQALQRLTVQSFTFSADTVRPQVEVPFHLIVSLHVRERVGAIEDVNLPVLAEVELLGDERQLTSGPSGTQYREIITVVAHHAGTIALAPATLQAIDARDGKAKQWFTNSLTLDVRGSLTAPLHTGEHIAAAIGALLLRVLLWAIGITCAIAVVVLLFRRRRAETPPPPPAPRPQPPAPPIVAARSKRAQVEDALTVLRAQPTRASSVSVRSAMWRMVGAWDGETLGDVLQRPEATEPRTRDILRALERAAFTYDDDLGAAITDACTALERYLA
jgi:hypothetical protein